MSLNLKIKHRIKKTRQYKQANLFLNKSALVNVANLVN